MEYKSYIDILSALLTPVIAIVTTYIAIQQYRNNRLKLRHDLYDRRLAVLKATNRFILSAWQSRGFSWENLREFALSKSEAYFLFDDSLYEYLEGAYERGLKILILEEQRERTAPEEEQTIIYEIRDNQKWFGDQRETLNRKFEKYLSLKALK
jgi:hypothetical protein